ncbi:patatin-related protein [Amycolatopsis pretoriensis]|uniref:Patatin-related protein n=1 Tax=Amycolatopsis pretoriensis TaxID=218821 RepID=A0A1H5QWJ7_9PSEU|nr:patatin-like protein [Amycolatopsis pretoriensis]SEF29698.1 patatin-related protein [Amycolatopsis pretoriensis]
MTETAETQADALPRQEIRLAMTMVGGASLAVWMGGVASETSQLLREARGSAPAGLYRKLTGLLRADLSVDVLTGTSAGGVNAACLGLAEAFGSTPECLRDTWISTGSLDNLTRDPAEPDPRSLLDGDRVLLDGVRGALEQIVRGGQPAAAGAADLTVLLTGTMIDGESTRYEDALGNLVRDTEHRMLFRFHGDQWRTAKVVAPLALAARSTASYPGAFELSRVPVGADQADEQHPDMGPYTALTRSHWVTDGGVLLNKPLRPALQEIFARPAAADVRRLLLYVVPTGEREAEAHPCDPKDFPLLTNTMGKVVTAVMSQSISSELEELSRHNAGVTRTRDTRVILAGLGLRGGAESLIDQRLSAAYLERRTAADAAELVELAARRYAQSRVDSPELQWFTGMSVSLRQTVAAGLAQGVPIEPPATRMSSAALVPYRTSALADAVATGLQLINAGFRLGPEAADAAVLNQARAELHRARMDSAREEKLDQWVMAHAAPEPDQTLATWLRELAREWALLGKTPGLADAWSAVVVALRTTAPALRRLVEERPDDSDTVRTLLDWLALDGEPDDDVVRARLLALHVAGRGLLAEAPAVDQRADLVQVSADSRSLLDMARRRSWDKLTGMQAGYFGAFYKASWRANDWMWGRIDGAGWLMQVLLDPVRLRNLRDLAGRDAFREEVRSTFLAIGWCPPREADNLEKADVDVLTCQLGEELAFLGLDARLEPLEETATAEPASMPVTALVLARARQLEIARAELPVVCRHAEDDVVKEKGSDKKSKVFRGLAKPELPLDGDGQTQQTFQACRVSAERISDERGSPLLVKTMIKLAAAGVNAAAATVPPSTPKAAKSMVTAVRATARSTWRITKGSMALKTPGTIVAAALALVAGLLMGGNGSVVVGLIGLPVLAGAVVFVVVNVLLMSKKSPLVFAYLLALLAVLGLLLAPFLPVLARPFFGWLGSVVAGWGRGDAPVWWVVFVVVLLLPWVVPPLGTLWRWARPGDRRPAVPVGGAKAEPVVLATPATVTAPDATAAAPEPAPERTP